MENDSYTIPPGQKGRYYITLVPILIFMCISAEYDIIIKKNVIILLRLVLNFLGTISDRV